MPRSPSFATPTFVPVGGFLLSFASGVLPKLETLADSGGGTLAFTGGWSAVGSLGGVAVSCCVLGLFSLSSTSPSMTATMSGLHSSSIELRGSGFLGLFLFPTFCVDVSPPAIVELVSDEVAFSFFFILVLSLLA